MKDEVVREGRNYMLIKGNSSVKMRERTQEVD